MRTRRGSTPILALTCLLAGGCVYDLAPNRATAARWDNDDADDRRIVARETPSVLAQTRPPELEQVDQEEGYPFVAAAGPIDEPARDAAAQEREDVEEERTTAQLAEEPAAEEDDLLGTSAPAAPRLEAVAPEPELAEEQLAEIADEAPPTTPLISTEGYLRESACPVELSGTDVTLVQRPEGPTLVFKTENPRRVEELQSRVLALALTKDDQRIEGGTSGEGADIEGLATLPPAEVTVGFVDDGAEMLFRPLRGTKRDALTQQLGARAEVLRDGDCPAEMMSMVVVEPGGR